MPLALSGAGIDEALRGQLGRQQMSMSVITVMGRLRPRAPKSQK